MLAITLIAACAAALVWALGRVLHLFGPVLWPLAVAAVLAYLLDPVVDLLQRRGMKRPRAILAVFAVAALIVLGVGAAVVPRLVSETRQLAARVPDYARQLQQRSADWLENSDWLQRFLKSRLEPAPVTTNTVAVATELQAPTATLARHRPQ